MTIQFPSFDPGTPGTLLDSENAKQVKTFLEAFNSVQIVFADKNEFSISDRNVVISIDKKQLAAATNSSTGTTEGAAIDVVGNDGKLNKVPKHSTWTTPSAYPSALRVDAGSTIVTMDSGFDFAVRNSGFTQYARLGVGFFVVQVSSAGSNVAGDSTGFQVYNASTGKILTIPFSSLTRDMTIQEIDVCVSGVAKKMLVLASAPY